MAKNKRREFLKTGSSLLGIGLALPALSTVFVACDKNEGPLKESTDSLSIKVSDYPGLSQTGGSAKVKNADFNDGYSVLIIRTADTEYLTYTSKCTHRGCEVNTPDSDTIRCPCHGAAFAVADGTVLNKPADNSNIAPLPKLQNTFNANTGILTISF